MINPTIKGDAECQAENHNKEGRSWCLQIVLSFISNKKYFEYLLITNIN